MQATPSYRYLDLAEDGLVLLLDAVRVDDEGRLQLAAVPASPEEVGAPLMAAAALTGPAGLGVDGEGNIYMSDPAGHRIVRVDACDDGSAPLTCLRGPGRRPGEVDTPRGLAVGPHEAIYVADSGNHRVQIIDLGTLQLRGVLGQPDAYGMPRPYAAAGFLNDPWDVAVDADGMLYVADHGNRRVQKFAADGVVDAAFANAISSAGANAPQEPTHVSLALVKEEERLLVLDRVQGAVKTRLLVFRPDGTYDAVLTSTWQTAVATRAPGLFRAPPAGIAFGDEVLYVGDAGGSRVLAFDADGRFLGEARGFRGRVTALALDRRGRLLVHPGPGGTVVRFASGGAATSGTFRIGPIAAEAASASNKRWHRLALRADPFPSDGHVQLFTYTTAEESHRPPALPLDAPDGGRDGALAPRGAWQPAPLDALDLLILNEPADYLWVGGRLQSGQSGSPVLSELRVEQDDAGWLSYLPSVYQRDEPSRVFLQRLLALFESVLGDEEALIDDLPLLFDPAATPAAALPGEAATWLEWLAGWLAFEFDGRWDEADRRDALRRAFELHGRRGTAEGLAEALQLHMDAPVSVSDRDHSGDLWTLACERSTLGFGTALAPAEAQGAVLGTTATLDRSHLIADEEYGAPLFEDAAHRFCVQAYAADLTGSAARETLVRVLEREKPAHTTYHLCVLEPRMRVGFQARIGVDAIVGVGTSDFRLGGDRNLGTTALATRTLARGAVVGGASVRHGAVT